MAMYAGSDQETTQVDYAMQLLSARLCIPADPLVPIFELQGGCAESQATKPTMFRADQIANLRTYQRTGPSGVLLDHQLIPDADLGISLHLDQLKFLNSSGC